MVSKNSQENFQHLINNTGRVLATLASISARQSEEEFMAK
jgi:hypothetical protein